MTKNRDVSAVSWHGWAFKLAQNGRKRKHEWKHVKRSSSSQTGVNTVPQWQINLIPVTEEQPGVSTDAEVSWWPEKRALLETSCYKRVDIQQSVSERCCPTVACIQTEQRLALGQAYAGCYESKLARVQEDETGCRRVISGNVCNTTFVAYDLLNASAWGT